MIRIAIIFLIFNIKIFSQDTNATKIGCAKNNLIPISFLDGIISDTSTINKISPHSMLELEIYNSKEAKEKFGINSENGIVLVWVDKKKYKKFKKKPYLVY